MKETIYTWILIKKLDNTYLMPHRSTAKPKYGNNGHEKDFDPDVEWIEWNNPLPEDIDKKAYTLSDLEEWYNNTYDENGELKAV